MKPDELQNVIEWLGAVDMSKLNIVDTLTVMSAVDEMCTKLAPIMKRNIISSEGGEMPSNFLFKL